MKDNVHRFITMINAPRIMCAASSSKPPWDTAPPAPHPAPPALEGEGAVVQTPASWPALLGHLAGDHTSLQTSQILLLTVKRWNPKCKCGNGSKHDNDYFEYRQSLDSPPRPVPRPSPACRWWMLGPSPGGDTPPPPPPPTASCPGRTGGRGSCRPATPPPLVRGRGGGHGDRSQS